MAMRRRQRGRSVQRMWGVYGGLSSSEGEMLERQACHFK